MKLLRVQETADCKYVKVRPGWSIDQWSEAPNDYIDASYVEYSLNNSAANEMILIITKITFNLDSNGHVGSAYMIVELNKPDGDHESSNSYRLDVEYAISTVFMTL